MRSKSRLTSKALRRGVPLKTMCSRKCVTPQTSGVSSRAPVRTKKPTAADLADGMVSPMSCRPLGRVWWWKGIMTSIPKNPGSPRPESARGASANAPLEDSGRGEPGLSSYFERLRPQRDDAKVLRREPLQVVEDRLRRQPVNGRLDLLRAADAAEVVPVRRQRAGPR